MDLLLTETRTITVTVPASGVDKGFPIGQGRCKAVILRLNNYLYNTTTNALTPTNQGLLYYGDSSQQRFELIRSASSDINSELIICSDLNQVWIKGIPNVANEIQVIIYG